MGFHQIEESPDVRLAHLVSIKSSTIGLETTTTTQYHTYPIGITRPNEGRTKRGVYCGTCKQYVEIIVPSAQLARRNQNYWLVPTVILLGAFIAFTALFVYRVSQTGLHLIVLGGLLMWLLSFPFIIAPMVICLDRAQTAHGVKVARSQPRKSRSRHSIRRPPRPAGARTRTWR
jgi:hypothetical protein